jgi:hypothetical protein
MTSSL